MRERTARTGWRSLLEWGVAFGLVALSVIGAASIGLFVAPFAIAAITVAVVRNRIWPAAPLGGLLGAGALCLFVAYRNRGYTPCPPNGSVSVMRMGERFSCGGFDPVPWLIVGLALAGAGLAGHLLLQRRRHAAAT